MVSKIFKSSCIQTSSNQNVNIQISNEFALLNEENWKYSLNSDGASITLTACCEVTDNIIIPSHINGYIVSILGDSLFYYNRNITSVIIPSCVKIIERSAFEGCSRLYSITIPESVSEIGDFAFCLCINLTLVHIPDSVIHIGYGAFYSCSRLFCIILGSGLKTILDYTFYNDDNIRDFYYYGTALCISNCAFSKIAIDNMTMYYIKKKKDTPS